MSPTHWPEELTATDWCLWRDARERRPVPVIRKVPTPRAAEVASLGGSPSAAPAAGTVGPEHRPKRIGRR